MKSLISIIFLVFLAISLSGCTIVNERCRHRRACNEVIVTSRRLPVRPAPRPHPNVTRHRSRHGRPEPGRMHP